jgi:HPt (histidine-containing phosphotransfer) domain-containing protein
VHLSELATIDLDLGAYILGADRKIALGMVRDLIVDLDATMDELEKGYRTTDFRKLHAVAHYIHGGACYCGTPRLKAAASALEAAAHNATTLAEVEQQYQHLCASVELLKQEANEITSP